MNKYDNNLNKIYKIAQLAKQLKTIDRSIKKKINLNKVYVKYLNNLLNSSMHNYNMIHQNLISHA